LWPSATDVFDSSTELDALPLMRQLFQGSMHVVAKRTSDFSKRDFAVEQDFVSTLRDTTFPATIKPRRRHNANASISPHAHDEIAAAIYT